MLHRKGGWRTLLGLKGELWYYGETEKSQSPRPHNLTILLGLLSPMLALAAIAISYKSFQIGERSMKVGQQAYLSLSVLISPSKRPLFENDFEVSVKISNVGNTPATIDAVRSRFVDFDNIEKAPEWQSNVHPLSVDAKGDSLLRSDAFFNQKVEVLKRFKAPSEQSHGVIGFIGFIRWHDAFDQRHTSSWCYSISFNPSLLSGTCATKSPGFKPPDDE